MTGKRHGRITRKISPFDRNDNEKAPTRILPVSGIMNLTKNLSDSSEVSNHVGI
ncbi:MAG: hypothetical protein HQM10_22575 [Candidatus Riflebacteria bacterium]|nr:hypothetical protein [Candidatus Riflebacteria bacterium]